MITKQAFSRPLLALAVALVGCDGTMPVENGSDEREVANVPACTSGATVQGIDVSEYQDTIDWAAVRASGRGFAIARIGDGYYRDPTFAANWNGIAVAGMRRGAYQFFRAADDPVAQANIVVEAVGRLGAGDLPVTLDIEDASMQGQPAAVIQAHVAAWIDAVRLGTGKRPIIYTGYYSWTGSVGSSAFGADPLWIAAYTTSCPRIPTGWNGFTMWQYSGSGRVPGIGPAVDLDVFNGSESDLAALAGQADPGTEAPGFRGIALNETGTGYWLAASDGAIFSYGQIDFYGSLGGKSLVQPVVGVAASHDGAGYLMAGSDGGVFAFGDAAFHGSMAGKPLNAPVVGIDASASGGYWLVASDGGVFGFDAGFYGSMGGKTLNKPVVGIAGTPTGKGYWLVASDGGIFAFGDAGFHGSMGGKTLAQPVVGMAATPSSNGYWLVASDGGVFAFGDALFHGSMGGKTLAQPIVGMTATPDGGGYYLVASDGGVFTFGNAVFHGSRAGQPF